MLRVPELRAWLRLLAVGFGSVAFFWLSVEDQTALPAALLGIGGAALACLLAVLGRWGGSRLTGRQAALLTSLLGVLIGISGALATVLLMFLKTAWHSHVYPDFPVPMMLDMLTRLPVWGIAGGLAGLAIGLIWLAFNLPPTAAQSDAASSSGSR